MTGPQQRTCRATHRAYNAVHRCDVIRYCDRPDGHDGHHTANDGFGRPRHHWI